MQRTTCLYALVSNVLVLVQGLRAHHQATTITAPPAETFEFEMTGMSPALIRAPQSDRYSNSSVSTACLGVEYNNLTGMKTYRNDAHVYVRGTGKYLPKSKKEKNTVHIRRQERRQTVQYTPRQGNQRASERSNDRDLNRVEFRVRERNVHRRIGFDSGITKTAIRNIRNIEFSHVSTSNGNGQRRHTNYVYEPLQKNGNGRLLQRKGSNAVVTERRNRRISSSRRNTERREREEAKTRHSRHNEREDIRTHSLREDTGTHSLREVTRTYSLREDTRTHSLREDTRIHSLREDTRTHSLREDTRTHSLREDTRTHSLRSSVRSDIVTYQPIRVERRIQRRSSEERNIPRFEMRQARTGHERRRFSQSRLDNEKSNRYSCEKERTCSRSRSQEEARAVTTSDHFILRSKDRRNSIVMEGRITDPRHIQNERKSTRHIYLTRAMSVNRERYGPRTDRRGENGRRCQSSTERIRHSRTTGEIRRSHAERNVDERIQRVDRRGQVSNFGNTQEKDTTTHRMTAIPNRQILKVGIQARQLVQERTGRNCNNAVEKYERDYPNGNNNRRKETKTRVHSQISNRARRDNAERKGLEQRLATRSRTDSYTDRRLDARERRLNQRRIVRNDRERRNARSVERSTSTLKNLDESKRATSGESDGKDRTQREGRQEGTRRYRRNGTENLPQKLRSKQKVR